MPFINHQVFDIVDYRGRIIEIIPLELPTSFIAKYVDCFGTTIQCQSSNLSIAIEMARNEIDEEITDIYEADHYELDRVVN